MSNTEPEQSILLIDDDPDHLLLIEMLIKRAGYRVLPAKGVCEGLRLLSQNKVDLIVSDMRMPLLSGSEFATALAKKRSPGKPKIPFLLITADVTASDEIASEAGADAFCPKQQLSRHLVPKIQELLSSPRTDRGN